MAGLAALMALTAGVGASPAAAQIGIQIGPDRPRVIERRDYDREPRVIERREYYREEPRVIERRVVRPARRVCRTEIRERVRPNGVIVRRPVQVCTTRGY